MPVETRQSDSATSGGIGTGIYLAKIISHLDASFMGGLEVTLLKDDGNVVGESSQTYPVKYASPFFGNTAFEFMGYNTADFDDTQKSYGMWFVPPDVGVTVLVVFVDGRTDQGYWFGCVPGRFVNHMVPGIATSEVTIPPIGEEATYDVSSLPAAEINRRSNDLGESLAIEKIPRAMHPIADRFLEQGLLEDDVRGTTTASSRRNVPSQVFGISTPGPLDYAGKRNYVGASDSPTESPVPVSRLGGTQFVMDDGDQRYNRATNASEGGPEYVDAPGGEAGIPKDELLRFRTRTGHQILMHNSEDLIYIGNAKGTSWIELTSDGKIDIFAEDSINIHTKQDLNLYADRDINMEAGRNINMKASAEYSKAAPEDEIGKIKDANEFEAGRIQIESAFNTNILVGANFKLQTLPYKDAGDADQDGNIEISSTGYTKYDVGNSKRAKTGSHNFSLQTSGSNSFTAGGSTNILSTLNNSLTAGLNNSFLSATHLETAAAIHMNGPPAIPAFPAASPDDAAETDPPSIVAPLSTYDNIVVDPVESEWIGLRYQFPTQLKSIMRRIPMHEPWYGHENLDPLLAKFGKTDREGDHPEEGAA